MRAGEQCGGITVAIVAPLHMTLVPDAMEHACGKSEELLSCFSTFSS